ncbi:4Fe-4S dicluster domain-containing protein [Thermodesulfobacteriota bacterium]
MQQGFYFDQTRCTGCFTCTVACKDWHDVPAGSANWMAVNCIEEGIFPDLFVAYIIRPCFHCENSPCVDSCPVGAISKSPQDGIVVVDRNVCLGIQECGGACKEACPYDAPQFGDEAEAKMQKCDMCIERWQQDKKPICVEACPMRALDAGPLDELKKKYSDAHEAAGFAYIAETRPSIVMKAKKC